MSSHCALNLGRLQTRLRGSWPHARPGVRGLWPHSAPGAGRRVAWWPLSLSPPLSSLSQALQEARGPALSIAPHPRLHRHFNARQIAGCGSFKGGGGPGAPRAKADSDRRRSLTRAPLGTDARPCALRARVGQPRPGWPQAGQWQGSCCWRPPASEERLRGPSSPSARMC